MTVFLIQIQGVVVAGGYEISKTYFFNFSTMMWVYLGSLSTAKYAASSRLLVMKVRRGSKRFFLNENNKGRIELSAAGNEKCHTLFVKKSQWFDFTLKTFRDLNKWKFLSEMLAINIFYYF